MKFCLHRSTWLLLLLWHHISWLVIKSSRMYYIHTVVSSAATDRAGSLYLDVNWSIILSHLSGLSTLQVSLQSTPSASPSACYSIHPGSPLLSGSSLTLTSSQRWEWCLTVSSIYESFHFPHYKPLVSYFVIL